jgi:hypothetical protein
MKFLRFPSWLAVIAIVLTSGVAGADAQLDGDRLRELNYEYAKFYKSVSGLRMLDELLLVKLEAKETEELVEKIAAFGSRTKSELDDLKRAHPEISFDNDGRTELAREASKRQQRDRLKSYAPVTGASGADFDRMLLLGQSAALYQMRFKVDAMADAEANPQRRKYLRGVRKDLDQLYVEAVKLLDKHYFKPPARTPLGEIGAED